MWPHPATLGVGLAAGLVRATVADWAGAHTERPPVRTSPASDRVRPPAYTDGGELIDSFEDGELINGETGEALGHDGPGVTTPRERAADPWFDGPELACEQLLTDEGVLYNPDRPSSQWIGFERGTAVPAGECE